MVNHGGHGAAHTETHAQADEPHLLDALVQKELTPELEAKYNEFAAEYLDSDVQGWRTMRLGEKINSAYTKSIGDIPGLHEGEDYSRDFETEEYKVAKRLFENDKTDYVHNKKQAKKIAAKFMLEVLKEMGGASKEIAETYESLQGQRHDEDRFEYLKSQFNSMLGISPQDRERSVDTLIEIMARSHRAKQALQVFGSKWKDKYASHLASQALAVFAPEKTEGKAYAAFIKKIVGEKGLSPKESETATHTPQEWATIQRELYNFERYQHPYEKMSQLGVHPTTAAHESSYNSGNGAHAAPAGH